MYDSTTGIVGIHCNSISSNGVLVSNGGPRITSSLYDKVMYTVMSCEYDVDEDGKYILGIAPSTTCLTVKTNMSGGTFEVKNHNGVVIGNGATIATGMTLCHALNNTLDSYAIVIYGDVDGHGLVSVSDVTELRSLIVAGNASGAYLKAGDLDGDGRLSSSDVVELRALIAAG